MSIPKITGREARELLDGTTPGPWEWDRQTGDIASPPYILAETFIDADANGPLIASAPDLAETVVWLYGQPAQRTWEHIRYWWESGDNVSVAASSGIVSCFAATKGNAAVLTPDEAVDLARALLAAAEEARP